MCVYGGVVALTAGRWRGSDGVARAVGVLRDVTARGEGGRVRKGQGKGKGTESKTDSTAKDRVTRAWEQDPGARRKRGWEGDE